jgi:hypothetical protein
MSMTVINLISREVGGVYEKQKLTGSNLPPIIPEETYTQRQETSDIPHVDPDTFRRRVPRSSQPYAQFPAQSATRWNGRIFKPCKKNEEIPSEILTEPRTGKFDLQAKLPQVSVSRRPRNAK